MCEWGRCDMCSVLWRNFSKEYFEQQTMRVVALVVITRHSTHRLHVMRKYDFRCVFFFKLRSLDWKGIIARAAVCQQRPLRDDWPLGWTCPEVKYECEWQAVWTVVEFDSRARVSRVRWRWVFEWICWRQQRDATRRAAALFTWECVRITDNLRERDTMPTTTTTTNIVLCWLLWGWCWWVVVLPYGV